MFYHGPWIWITFNAFIVGMLMVDLLALGGREQAVSFRKGLAWTAFWVAIALLFALVLWVWGEEFGLLAHQTAERVLSEDRTAVQFLTAYLIEKSLSMDNIFVFLVIFQYFGIPRRFQHGVLFWGVLGALVFRLGFILLGVALLRHVHWVVYILGAMLLFTGVQLFRGTIRQMDPGRNPVLRLAKRCLPVTDDLAGGRFIVRREHAVYATPLLLALLVVETTDVLFAVDSVPAVLGITQDEFIAYASNALAILGLRALYFVLADVIRLFEDLHYGLAFILIFVGGKMIVSGFIELPEWMHWVSLGVVVVSLTVTMLISVVRHRGESASSKEGDG